MQEISFSGKLKLGHQVKIGYFAQNQASLLNENLTVFETIDQAAVGEIRTKIRDILGAFMFGGEASDKKVKVLSGGERSRLAMIKLLLEPVNLLILDEPTNHLDMRSKDVLKDALKAFTGTAVIVSHDREFLDGLVNKVYEFSNKKIREYLGGIYDFLHYKKIESLQELETNVPSSKSSQSQDVSPEVKGVSDNKLSYEARKEQNRKIRKAERDVSKVEMEVEKLEAALNAMQAELQHPEKASDSDFILKMHQKQRALDQKMYEWEILTETLENLKTE